MDQIIDVDVDGKIIHIEVEPVRRSGSERTSVKGKVTKNVANMFEEAKSTITTVAANMVNTVNSMDKDITPDEFNLGFAIKFTAEGQAVVAKASVAATLQVSLTYKPGKTDAR